MGPRKYKQLDLDDTPPPAPKPAYIGQSFTPSGSVYSSPGTSTLPSGTATPSSAGQGVDMNQLVAALKLEETPLAPALRRIATSSTANDTRKAVDEVVAVCRESPSKIGEYQLRDGLRSLLTLRKSAQARIGALNMIGELAHALAGDSPGQAYIVECLPLAFDAAVDKDSGVKTAASAAQHAVLTSLTPEALAAAVLSKLWVYLASGPKWQAKVAALEAVDYVIGHVPDDYVEQQFVDGIPSLTAQLHEFKPEVAKLGRRVITKFMGKLDNQDVVPRLDAILAALEDPKRVEDCIRTLSAVTFVAEVTEPCLAVLVPILSRSLGVTASQESLRQAVAVTENLTRLVHNPWEVRRYIPELLPGVQQVVRGASQPEVRELAQKALVVLEHAQAETGEQPRITLEQAQEAVPLKIREEVTYVASLVQLTVNTREFSQLSHILRTYCGIADPHAVVGRFENMFADSRAGVDDGDAENEVVNAKFSLAYGGRMLLSKATLRLFRGHRYGLVGRNGCGKSTLMRSIANGKLEGFPPPEEVRTCFVEHRLQGSDADIDVATFVTNDGYDRAEVERVLEEVGFTPERQSQAVGALSGGWKMKLELARAVLMKADILLLDEPTNHLDAANVKWLQDWLVNSHATCLIVSHDSGFLDTVCTDITHYEGRRLAYYHGNLSEFVKVRPEARSYYELTNSQVRMAFPPPGGLSGVRSATRAVARMSRVSFRYPGAANDSLSNVSCALALSSRVALRGPNGAGKSTLIKLLTGELIPSSGTVEKHPNLRIGYIAQHAFQHVEKHKDLSPSQYLQWRYQNGDDREMHLKQTRQMSEEEEAAVKKPQDLGDGGRHRVLEAVIGRQKLKKSFRYEIQWVGFLPKHNTWMSREEMLERGFGKLVQAFDDHEAAREGLGYRDLTPPAIRKHFEDVGLDGDIAEHTRLGSLSGGQLVKVVIAGATWNNPHLLVLDEPTNYLDRDSLGGLAAAIQEWSGGVLLISHNAEFVDALCPEQWLLENGTLVVKGNAAAAPESAASSAPTSTATSAAPSDTDSPLNIKVRQKKKKLTRNELKEREVRRRLRHLEWLSSPKGTPKPEDTDEE